MPSVPVYQRQATPGVNPGVRAESDAVDTSAISQGLNQTERVVAQYQEQARQQADTTAVLAADNKLTQWTNDTLYNQDSGVYTKKGANAVGVTGQTMQQFDQVKQDVLSGLSNDQQRQRVSQLLTQHQTNLSNSLNRYEYGQHQEYMGQTEDATIQLATDSAALDPTNAQAVGQNRAKAMDVVAAKAQRMGWSPEETQAQQLNVSSKLLTGVIGRVAQQDLGQAKTMFEASKEGLSANAQLSLTDHFQQEQRRLDAEARQRVIEQKQLQAIAAQALSSRLSDAQSALVSGVTPADMPTKQEILYAHGPIQGQKIYDQLNKLSEVAPAMQELRTATPEQTKAIVDAHDPTKNVPTNADGVPVVAPGFKTDNEVHGIIQRAAVQFARERDGDPAAYVVKTSPAVQQAYVAAQQNPTPETNAAYITASFAEQRRQGVADPKVLPVAQASAISNKLTQAEPTDQARMLSQLSETYGPAYTKVMTQLGGDAPVQTVAGMVGSANKNIDTQRSGVFSQGISRTPEFIQNTLLSGDAALKSKAYKLPPSTNTAGEITTGPDKAFYDVVNGAGLDPKSIQTYHAAYQSYYAGLAVQNGKFGEAFEPSYGREALKAIGLSPVEIGAGKTLPPYGMDENAFKDRLSAQFDAFNKTAGTKHSIGEVKFYAGPNSTYTARDALGNKLTTLKVDQ